METGYLLALTTGLLGGFGHCIGMCGPLVASFGFRRGDASGLRVQAFSHLLYHSGRVFTYMVIGAVMGLTGSFLNVAGRLAGIQDAVAIGAGLFIVIMGLGIIGWKRGPRWIESKNRLLLRTADRTGRHASIFRFFLLGLLFGMLPCGLSYSLFLSAAATGAPLAGALIMLCFGAGTTPSLLLFGALVTVAGSRVREWAYRLGGVVIVVMGTLFLLRGLHLHG
jgi:sulfite exporter TauE/SafE